jgi:hypothetical protein
MRLRIFVPALILFVSLLVSPTAFAKGKGVGFWMEGTVSDVAPTPTGISFRLKGRFWFSKYLGSTPTIIDVDGKDGIVATVRQGDPLFAFSADWRAGSIQEPGGLLRILKKASEQGGVVKFELREPSLKFDSKQILTLTDAAVIRATDADLR